MTEEVAAGGGKSMYLILLNAICPQFFQAQDPFSKAHLILCLSELVSHGTKVGEDSVC